jgi:hypothetical protein
VFNIFALHEIAGTFPARIALGETMQRHRRRQRGTPQTNRTAIIGFRVEPHVKDTAELAAARDHRTLSSLLEKILVEFLCAQGLLARAGHNL